MRFDLQRAPSAACIEQRADLFDHRVGRPDDEDMINEEFKIGLERIDACILGKAVHHAEAPPDRDQVAVEAVADRAFHHEALRLGIGVCDEHSMRPGVATEGRSEERSGGKAWGKTGYYGGSPD